MRRTSVITLTLLTFVATSACSDPAESTCAVPTLYATPQDTLTANPWVTGATVKSRGPDVLVNGVSANSYIVANLGYPSIQGDSVGFIDLPVVSTPSCDPADPYPDGDPLANLVGSEATLFLLNTDHGWATISSEQGVIPQIFDAMPASW